MRRNNHRCHDYVGERQVPSTIPIRYISQCSNARSSQKWGPPGTKFACNPSGYMTTELFEFWLDHVVEHVHATEAKPVLLLVDGHSSHAKNLAVTEKARKAHITILVLPPHCINKMQSLDVSFMAPFKTHYSKAAEDFLRNNPGDVISKYDIISLMAFEKAATIPTAINGFRNCGLWPCNWSISNECTFALSLVADQPLSAAESETTLNKQDTRPKQVNTAGPSEAVDDSKDDSKATNSSFTISPEKICPLPKMTQPRVT
ncbi:uncharacterized protein LOC129765611 [Toxorhynchites rutilus septentrionalis]|uniref:uncharacterized protein LOC129765611 n=1 Tax=Toxorhynchites rutilus septentrionalis TaxID=329112 RepID=UPI00247B1A30|nr:uncharacterized protein LOC129765611 [Toxorhynchites rutilus septentrionalis]